MAGIKRTPRDLPAVIPAADSLKQQESLFAENHEPFFNIIDPKRTSGLFQNT